MLKHKSKILFCIFLIIILISTVSFATDEVKTTGSEAEVTSTSSENTESTDDSSESKWKNDDLYLFDKDIVIEGVVDGNVFAFGTNVTVKGEICGDLFVFAETLNIDGGYVYSSIFGFAKTFNMNGIAYDIYAASNDFTLTSDAYIYRDLKLLAVNTTINGKIRRNAHIASNNIKFPENTTDTFIGGNLNYTASNELSIPESAVLGDINFTKSAEEEAPSVGSKISSIIFDILTLIVSTLVLTLLSIWLTPKFMEKVSTMKISNIFIALAIGLGVLIGVPVASILVMFTIIGMPTAFALLALYFLIIAFAVGFTSIVISSFVTKKFNIEGKFKFILIAIASTFIICLLGYIPFVGGLIKFLTIPLALGTVVYNLFRKTSIKE